MSELFAEAGEVRTWQGFEDMPEAGALVDLTIARPVAPDVTAHEISGDAIPIVTSSACRGRQHVDKYQHLAAEARHQAGSSTLYAAGECTDPLTGHPQVVVYRGQEELVYDMVVDQTGHVVVLPGPRESAIPGMGSDSMSEPADKPR